MLTTEPAAAAVRDAVIPGADAAALATLTVSAAAAGGASLLLAEVVEADDADDGATSRTSEPGAAVLPFVVAGVDVASSTGLEFLRRGVAAAAEGNLAEERPEAAGDGLPDPLDDERPEDAPSEDDESPTDAPPRPLRVAGALVDEPDACDEASEDEPAEPVVSANAIGIAEIPDPTPRASARAPTRPM